MYHEQLSTAFNQRADMPTPETWLWGSGFEVLSDTRFGEYQLGMAVRYSRMVFRDDMMLKEAQREALTAEFGALHRPCRHKGCSPQAAPSS